jgi:uncharacterized protein YbjT (DUF2867 family)
MNIAILGATGFSGRYILAKALARGHTVRAIVRTPENLQGSHKLLTVVRGNPLREEDVRPIVQHADAVLHCIGVGGKGDGKRTTLVSDSVVVLLSCMHPGQRLVCMSNVGAGATGTWFANKVVIPVFLRWLIPLIEDKDRMEAALRASSVNYTSVRLPNIVNGPAKAIRESANGRNLSLSISTQSTAKFMLDQAENTANMRTMPCISN